MPSNREAYFEALKSNIPKSVIEFALKEVNDFNSIDLISHFDDEIKDYLLFKNAIDKYLSGEMIEYIFNKTFFLSTPYYVNKDVLIPRQETEQLVIRTIEIIKEMFGDKTINVADVCTGSGCIGISIAKALPNNNYFLTDISVKALHVADKNVSNLCNDIKISILNGDLLEPLKNTRIDIIVCNPPYIEDICSIDKKTWNQEPHLALLAKPSTLFYERILKDYKTVTNDNFLIAFEIGEEMESALTELVKKYCLNATYFFEKDMYGKTRFLFIKQ